MMTHPYGWAYLDEIVEEQGLLFDSLIDRKNDIDTVHFINSYMSSNTRKYIDEGQALICTMSADELWERFCNLDGYTPRTGETIQGFIPNWIGQFYAFFQWYYNIASSELPHLVPVKYLCTAYKGLHDLDLELAVKKVGDMLHLASQ